MSKKKPRIQECRHCSQKFTIHSLELHERRCLSNGQPFQPGQSTAKHPSSTSTDSDPRSRPKTMTLSAGSSHSSQKAPKVGVCYICGLRFGQSSLEIHERKCYKLWEQKVDSLPRSTKVTGSPKRFQVPSVDGTTDPSRADALATHSASAAQTVLCEKCSRTIGLLDAHEHALTCGKRKQRDIETHFIGMY